jgi:hypothetical protein
MTNWDKFRKVKEDTEKIPTVKAIPIEEVEKSN